MTSRGRRASARRGFFLTLEGIEGSGKSTHARMLGKSLEASGYPVFLTREPGGTPLGEELRRFLLGKEDGPVPEAELFLILAARAQHVQTVIRPRLDQGEVVLCDRFADATLAYQGGGRGLDRDRVEAANALAVGDVNPDLTVLFDIPVESALERVRHRHRSGGDFNRFDRETRRFHEAVRDVYLRLAEREPARFLVLRPTGPKAAVARELLAQVEPRIRARWKRARRRLKPAE
jgi:dTMP kinase